MTKPRVAVALCGVGVAVAALAGCSKSDLTPVKAAGDSSTTTATSVTTSTRVESSTPPSSAPSTTPTVAAPSNALTMSCTEFMGLDQATKQAVTTEIIAGNRTIVNPNNTVLAVVLAEAMCTHEPNSTVNTALGGPPA